MTTACAGPAPRTLGRSALELRSQPAGKVCGWTALLPPRRPRPALSGHVDCRVAVVGAGLVGLAAARRLAELVPGDAVVVLDAAQVGEGSAGRNSGFAIDVPLSHAMDAQPSLGNVEPAQLTLSRQAYRWLEKIVRGEGIECDWQRAGRYYAAATPSGEKALDGLMRQFDAIGEPSERLDAHALRERLGTSYYRGAVFNPSCTLLQPAALVRGLADRLPASVRLHENSAVLDWQATPGGHLLRTRDGSVGARRVIWATPAEVGRFSSLGGRYLKLYTYAGLTPRPSAAERGGGALPPWGVLPALRAGSTVRRLADGRVLLRSLWSYRRELDAAQLRRELQPLLAARFPQAAPGGFEFVWGGPVSITRHADPFFGEFRPGAYAFTGCNGSGIVKGSAYGRLLAEMACDQASASLALALRQPMAGWIPPEPLRRIAVHFTLRRNQRHVGAEI